MPNKTSTRPPKLCRHKSCNRAYVRINGKQIFLGPWTSRRTACPAARWPNSKSTPVSVVG